MTIQPARQLARLAVTLAAAAGALGCTGCGADDVPSCPSEGGAGSGGTAVTTSSSTSSSGQGGHACPDVPLPPGVPDGWVRMPSAPCECDVYMAPDPAHTRPVSWTSCGTGCLELVVDWSDDDAYRVLAQAGAAGGGYRYLGYTRYLGAKGQREVQIVRLPDNVVLFDAVYRSDAGPWVIGPRRLSPFGHLLELMGTDGPGHHSVMYFVPPDGSGLSVMLNTVVSWGAYEVSVSSDLWAMSYLGAMAWDWHERAFNNEMSPGWSSPDGRSMFNLEAVGSNVFFSTWAGDRLSHIEAWDQATGSAPLVSFPSKDIGGACCLETDGQTMVWFQASGYQGEERFDEVVLNKAPLATTAAELQPTLVRPAYQNHVLTGGGVVGGGYALHVESPLGAPIEEHRAILTRLADGHYWLISPRPGRLLSMPMYVDGEELALVESNPNGYHATNWTIVRLTIASLGDSLPPGSGF